MLLSARSAARGRLPLHEDGEYEEVDALRAVRLRAGARLFVPARLFPARAGTPVRCTLHLRAAVANALRADFGVEIFVRLIVLMRHFL